MQDYLDENYYVEILENEQYLIKSKIEELKQLSNKDDKTNIDNIKIKELHEDINFIIKRLDKYYIEKKKSKQSTDKGIEKDKKTKESTPDDIRLENNNIDLSNMSFTDEEINNLLSDTNVILASYKWEKRKIELELEYAEKTLKYAEEEQQNITEKGVDIVTPNREKKDVVKSEMTKFLDDNYLIEILNDEFEKLKIAQYELQELGKEEIKDEKEKIINEEKANNLKNYIQFLAKSLYKYYNIVAGKTPGKKNEEQNKQETNNKSDSDHKNNKEKEFSSIAQSMSPEDIDFILNHSDNISEIKSYAEKYGVSSRELLEIAKLAKKMKNEEKASKKQKDSNSNGVRDEGSQEDKQKLSPKQQEELAKMVVSGKEEPKKPSLIKRAGAKLKNAINSKVGIAVIVASASIGLIAILNPVLGGAALGGAALGGAGGLVYNEIKKGRTGR